jgi:hypothetical protein
MSRAAHFVSISAAATIALLSLGNPASAAWKAANPEVTKAASEPRIAAVLSAVDKLDRSVIEDNHADFAALMADDLVVNNPQNGISGRGVTVQLDASGRISYSAYDRSIEFAGVQGETVVLMGEEIVVPKGSNPMAGQQIHRRFTDLWKNVGGHWLLAVRQSTIIAPKP